MSMSRADILVDAIEYELDRSNIKETEAHNKVMEWVNELYDLAEANTVRRLEDKRGLTPPS